MNAPTTIGKNLAIWNAVATTDPAHTKKVNQRGGFTAISAHYQVMRATEQFGPVGIGWGYVNGEPIWQDSLCVVPVTIWHGDRSNTFGPIYGAAEWRNGTRIDSDAPKKAATDGLTKGLSHLGFNADVFLGRFDDSKYVDELRREYAEQGAGEGQRQGATVSPPQAKPKAHSALKTAYRAFIHEANGCGDGDELSAFFATAESVKLVAEIREKLPHIWDGENWPEGQERPAEWEPLADFISRRQRECAEASAQYLTA
jgi:hypothetical protein